MKAIDTDKVLAMVGTQDPQDWENQIIWNYKEPIIWNLPRKQPNYQDGKVKNRTR